MELLWAFNFISKKTEPFHIAKWTTKNSISHGSACTKLFERLEVTKRNDICSDHNDKPLMFSCYLLSKVILFQAAFCKALRCPKVRGRQRLCACIFAGLGSVQVLNRSCSSGRMGAPNFIQVGVKGNNMNIEIYRNLRIYNKRISMYIQTLRI